MSPQDFDNGNNGRESWYWRSRIEENLAKVRAILDERGPRRDQWERDCAARISDIEKRLGVVELLCKGTTDTSTAIGKLSALSKDPAALIIVFLVISTLIKAGINPESILGFLK